MLTNSKDVTAFFDVVLNIVIRALIGELGQSNLFRCELLIKVEKVQTRRGKLFQSGRKNCCL